MISMKGSQKKVMEEFLFYFPNCTKKEINRHHFVNLLRLEKKFKVDFTKNEIEMMYENFLEMQKGEFRSTSMLIDYKVQLYILAQSKKTEEKLSQLSQIQCFLIFMIFYETKHLKRKDHLKKLYI